MTDLTNSPKHALFFLCDLIAVVQPATHDILEFYLREIIGDASVRNVGSLLGLACAMNLVQTSTMSIDGKDETFYGRNAPEESLGRPYHHSHRLDLPTERARQASVLQIIQDAQRALSLIAGAP